MKQEGQPVNHGCFRKPGGWKEGDGEEDESWRGEVGKLDCTQKQQNQEGWDSGERENNFFLLQNQKV